MNFQNLESSDTRGLVCIVIVAFCILKFILSCFYKHFLSWALGINAIDLRKTGNGLVHIQNSTLAGGVAIGATTHLMVQPFGAILIGMIAGALSVYGYTSISQVLEHRFGIQDTCGVHNLHGLPGVLGGLTAIVLASMATEVQYGKTLYEVYPARASPVISQNPEYIPLEAGDGRTAGQQAGYQAILILVTVLISVVSGIVSGYIINLGIWSNVSSESFYDDEVFWELPPNHINIENSQVAGWTMGIQEQII